MSEDEHESDRENEPHHPPPAVHGERSGWLRHNYILVLVLLVPVAIGILSYAFLDVRKLEAPPAGDVAYWTAQRFAVEGQYDEALQFVAEARRADPERLDALLLLARLSLNANGEELARIRSELESRLEGMSGEENGRERGTNEGAGAVHALLALWYRESDRRRAAAHDAMAGELAAETATGCYLRSVAAPRAEEATAWLEKGRTLDPDHLSTLKASALELYRRRRFDGMQSVLRRATEEHPRDASLLFLLAIALRGAGDPDGALPVHEEVLALRPRDPEAYRQRSLTHRSRRDPGQAALDAREAERLAPPGLRPFYRDYLREVTSAAGQGTDY